MKTELLRQLAIGIIVLCLIIGAMVLFLAQFSPFKECENKPDNYTIQLGDKEFSCGELKAVNTTI